MPITSPLDIAGCTLWLDTKDLTGVAKTGDTVTAMTDKSPDARHITTVIGSPSHGVRRYNGHPVVDLTPADSLESDASASLSQPATIFFVGGFDSDTNNMLLFRSSWAGHLRLTRNATGFHRLSISGGGISAAPSPLTGTLTTIVMDGSNSSIDVDGVVTTGNLGTTGPGGQIIVGTNCDGWFCQYIRFDSVLSSAQIQDVKDWLFLYLADQAVPTVFLPPVGHDYIEIQHAEATLPDSSILKGDTFVAGEDQAAYQTTATHTNSSTGTVVLDEFGVPTITGTGEAGTWTFNYWIKDANGDNTPVYIYSLVVV